MLQRSVAKLPESVLQESNSEIMDAGEVITTLAENTVTHFEVRLFPMIW